MSEFVRADLRKFETFLSESEEAIKEFSDIRDEFDRINDTLLDNWDGAGKAAYKKVADHITEKVGGIKDVLDTINNLVVKDIIDQYNTIDNDLAEYNRTAGDSESEGWV